MEKDGLVIVLNGEIYNYKNLRQQLEIAGVKFITEPGTEVVLEMYRKFGDDCVKKLIGMFAFAIYTLTSKEIFFGKRSFRK